MNNFEKFKADLTVKRLADMLIDALCVATCDYCSYNRYTCENACEFGVKKFLESEVNKMETEKLENAVVSLEDFITDLTEELSKEENQNKAILIPINEIMKNKTTVEMFEEYFDLLSKQTAEEIVNEILEEPGKLRMESEVE